MMMMMTMGMMMSASHAESVAVSCSYRVEGCWHFVGFY